MVGRNKLLFSCAEFARITIIQHICRSIQENVESPQNVEKNEFGDVGHYIAGNSVNEVFQQYQGLSKEFIPIDSLVLRKLHRESQTVFTKPWG